MASKPYILGINGGKKEGHVDQLLDICLEEAKKRGAETKKIQLSECSIAPICKVSKDPEHSDNIGEGNDGMVEISKEIQRADGIVFATPVHWFGPSSEMKVFIDRLTPFENAGFLLEGKVAGFIVYGNEGGKMNTLMQLSATVNHMGMLIPPYALIYCGEEVRGWSRDDIPLLAKNMLSLIQSVKKQKINFGYENSK
jgi:multimeric flavodoxin WrbA